MKTKKKIVMAIVLMTRYLPVQELIDMKEGWKLTKISSLPITENGDGVQYVNLTLEKEDNDNLE